MTTEDYKKIADTVPRQPGVYRFLDGEGTILYVGKAKNLKNRVASYFGQRRDRAHKTRVMVKNANRINFTIVETEADALLLENTLIKKHQPRYNVMLKDGKSYSYICIKNERFPRVFITRYVVRDGSTYFGPYTSKSRIKIILDLIKQLFPLRTCSFNLSESNIEAGKFKVCLEYHIKNCLGPCEGLEEESEYNEKIEQVKNILRGNFGAVVGHFKGEMQRHAENLDFEKAQQIKEKLTAFEDYQAKSTVVSTTIRDVDVFSIASDEKEAYINYIKVVHGAIIHTHTQELVKNLDDEEEDLLAYAIPILRERFNSIANEVILPYELELGEEGVNITVPKIGDKRKLLDLSEKNVKYYLLQKKKQEMNQTRKQTSAERILRTLQKDLQMDALPMHLECFDNSNIQGSHPVASCVVFKNAKPSKKDYRHFNIKTVEGPNDFASMTEVVYRRYKRLLEEQEPLPQLVIIDGGKGQLSSAMESIRKLNLEDKITVIGIAKKLEEIFFPNDPLPLYIDKKSESLKLIQQARNEAHRFAITFHRNQRSRAFLGTELTEIPGIGSKTAEKLLTHFGSLKKLRQATAAEIAEVSTLKVAQKIKEHFAKSEEA
ncbi:excinuclease ABC subunit UvrC [Flavilitoribacter nigricans]|uniref:UvrABC system protein C n=1 Tax=Flavilitoribacter nigricans (strain ATCC 23147 / DSM 23189 / NBRC 102662 / NCIMB 1420 / SS-2) TaxID=1122177 RepID=A0A2D0N050_FLAN2|nr:excinuclease ABC subunit UvrC [Flavilitoribacter nigricans]PHN01083.1 excinuclease ABC subunit C [Flavilitoribacter nigricans DSM 23189 = NBRC 102662]